MDLTGPGTSTEYSTSQMEVSGPTLPSTNSADTDTDRQNCVNAMPAEETSVGTEARERAG
ncbi:hypothetical protein HPB52_003734 [Rhipicephalus sanguineus]|uniref:Uncharacterized protein n=1 Tax=Rhipicephalus sanguineus TaxID=34632 RepID=A0A9D4Q588_RHISA|nr:hypothetical protein HPB52_003734 [Rhipicephalus sanguineus]